MVLGTTEMWDWRRWLKFYDEWVVNVTLGVCGGDVCPKTYRKRVGDVRVSSLERGGGGEESIDGPGRINRIQYACVIKIPIAFRSNGEEWTWCETPDDLREIERDLVGVVAVPGFYSRHVTNSGPRGDVVFVEASEPAVGDNHSQAIVECCREHGVVTTQRMPNDADSCRVDLFQGRQKVDRTDVVPNGFHAPAGVTVSGLKVVIRFTEPWVVGRQCHVPTASQVKSMGQFRITSDPRCF